ncbi:hypothetical protein ABPG74_004690 [Tetrahymena malaccensis]
MDLLIEHFKGLNIQQGEDPDQKEVILIDQFIAENNQSYEFSQKEHTTLTEEILYKRLCNREWLQSSNSINLLKILQIIRLLSRDAKILKFLMHELKNILEILTEIIADSTSKITGQVGEEEGIKDIQEINTAISINIEIIRIFKRLNCPDIYEHRRVFTNVIDLISVNNSLLLKTLLDFILHFFQFIPDQMREFYISEFGQIYYIGKLLFVCEKYDESFKMSAINILTKLMNNQIISDNFRRIQGIGTLIQELKKAKSLNLKICILNCMYQLLQKTEIVYDFKVFGIVPILLNILKNGKNFMEVLLTIDILSLLIMDDDLSVKIINSGLLNVTKFLICCHPMRKKKLIFEDIKPEQLNEAIFELELRCFKLLRFLFSIEKNRKIFKLLFPTKLFTTFIDIGNYQKNYSKYKNLAEEFNLLKEDELLKIEKNLVEIDKDLAITNDSKAKTMTQFGSYTLVEMIGKGAFGTVYLVRKGGNKYALKQIPFSNVDLRDKDGKQQEEVKINENNLEEYFKEVKIYKTLKHPNIVTYYESFIEDDCLCIVMEFVEGFNLSELIKLQIEKQDHFSEKQIWKVVVNLSSVLKYLHYDKKIVHRDLNPANIMIDNEFNVKLADFGLAKTLNQSVNMLQSFVGTLMYSCPEIVQNRPYSEKADVWSFGCVLYELMMLKPPFQSGNPLMLAKKIVDLEYESITKANAPQYSQELIEIVSRCLTVEEKERPSILEILSSISSQLVQHIDLLKDKEQYMNQEIILLTRKMNQKKANDFSIFDNDKKKPLIKIEPSNLHKIEDDPISKFLSIIQKISYIANYSSLQKNNYKKFLVDLFYNKVILNKEENAHYTLKSEIQHILNLSKSNVQSLNIKFDINQKQHQNVSYENLYFYIEELYSSFQKQ